MERPTKPTPPSNTPTAGMAEHLYYTTEHLVQLNIHVIPQTQLPLVLIFDSLISKDKENLICCELIWMWDMCRADWADQRWLLIARKKTQKKPHQIDLRWLDFYSWLNWKQMWWRASVAYNVLLELIYLACGANAEQLLCSCCSGSDVCHTELLGKDTGFRSACGPLWLNAQQTFRYVRSALMMRMFSRHELVFPAPFHVSHTFDRWLQIFLVFFCIFCLIAFESKRQIPHFISKLKHIILKSTPVLKCDRKLTIKLNFVFSPRCFFLDRNPTVSSLSLLSWRHCFRHSSQPSSAKGKRNAQIRSLIITRQQGDTVND